MEEIIQALQLKAELDALRPIDKEQEDRIMQKFRLDWNYHSNHLEGNSLTYGETKALILFGVTAQGKPLKDTLEITGHNEAINWVLEMIQGDRPLTENFIRELHSLLLQDSYKESKNAKGEIVPRKISAGKYKTTPNHVETVTGEIFYFATPEETPAKMFDLINWYNEKSNEKEPNPILIAAEFHYKFIRIHPFDDGNGRTARILMNFILMKFGFPPVIIKTEDKANYFAALQFADAGNIESFITYIAKNLNRSLEIMIAGAKGEDIEEDDDLDKEIALLNQRMETIKTIDKTIIKDVAFDRVKASISVLIKEYLSKMEKFQKLYTTSFYSIEIADSVYRDFNSLYLDIIKRNQLKEINIDFSYLNLKAKGFESASYVSMFDIVFDENTFRIGMKFENPLLINPIEKELTKSQIRTIVKSEVKRHKDFIEQLIIQKENK
jgi:Fic family protein